MKQRIEYMKFVHVIQENYHKLSKSEKRIADYILAAGEKVVYSTMKDLKDKTNVGDATIIRFCHKLGYSGFSDLKIDIAKEDFSKFYEQDEEKEFYDRILENLFEALNSTRRLVNKEDLKRAIGLITKARHIYIFGVGSSGITSMNLEKMFLRVGVHAVAVVDPHFQAHSASLLDSQDVVIGFSLSGRTKDTYDSLAIAKKNGAKIISVTNFLSSPIAGLGDVVLQTAIEEFFEGGSLAGKMSQLYLCETLVRGYEIGNQINAIKLREKVLRSIIDKSLD